MPNSVIRAQVERSKSRVSNGLSCERKSVIFEQVIEEDDERAKSRVRF